MRFEDNGAPVTIAGAPTQDNNAESGELLMDLDKCTDADAETMASVISASGWEQGGVSHGINVHKGPLRFQGGKNVDGCRFEITTVNISQYLARIEYITTSLSWTSSRPVPDLRDSRLSSLVRAGRLTRRIDSAQASHHNNAR